ncbi:MAG: class I SAM-dependent methyltransferase [Candidatus Poseidoniaceae archaeon]
MTMKLCLLVPLNVGEEARLLLIEQDVLDRAYSPKRIENELALPLVEGAEIDAIEFEHRFERHKVERAPPSIDPHSRLQDALLPMLNSNDRLIQTIPKKWERLDDLILFPMDAFLDDGWDSVVEEHEDFYHIVAKALNAGRVGRQQPIAADQMRTAQVELLYGDNGWVEVKDNGLVYGFDATKVMYSSGNVTERHRMASMPAEDEIVIDAYAGIGYYTMQLLVHANVKHIHACEINPNSILALEWSAKHNRVQSRLTVHSQDNQITLREFEGTVDRVLLGYLPSSEATWEPAVRALKATGGTLHIHMNVEEERIESWCQETMQKCVQYAKDAGRNWGVVSHHLEKVKWYAPRIRHVVLDVSFSSMSSAS